MASWDKHPPCIWIHVLQWYMNKLCRCNMQWRSIIVCKTKSICHVVTKYGHFMTKMIDRINFQIQQCQLFSEVLINSKNKKGKSSIVHKSWLELFIKHLSRVWFREERVRRPKKNEAENLQNIWLKLTSLFRGFI